jgi:hypothetical protein
MTLWSAVYGADSESLPALGRLVADALGVALALRGDASDGFFLRSGVPGQMEVNVVDNRKLPDGRRSLPQFGHWPFIIMLDDVQEHHEVATAMTALTGLELLEEETYR